MMLKIPGGSLYAKVICCLERFM